MSTSELEQVAGHDARNRVLIANILAKGGDLTAVRMLDLFFYAPSSEAGDALASALRSFGAPCVKVAPPAAERDLWSVQAQLEASVERVTSDLVTRQLVKLAAQHGAQFDGWGTEL